MIRRGNVCNWKQAYTRSLSENNVIYGHKILGKLSFSVVDTVFFSELIRKLRVYLGAVTFCRDRAQVQQRYTIETIKKKE